MTNLTIEDKKNEYYKRLDDLNAILESDEEKDEESDYVINSVATLYKKLIENEQFSDVSVTEPVFADKVVRCYRYIPGCYLDYYGVKDRIVVGGLFLTVKVCLLPNDLLKKCTKNRWKAYLHPELYGLPSCEDVNYATTRLVNAKVSVALARHQWYDDWINRAHQYEMVSLEV